MPLPPRIIPRQPAKELGILTPSSALNFTDKLVGNVPIQASRMVEQPTPYVAKAAQRTDLDQLAESLQIFNKTIGSINYQRQTEYVKGQEEQGAIDAASDPAKLREVFRNGLDAATEQGLFPKSAHPRYRMAYMQSAAKQLALGDLPAFIAENTKGLDLASNTEPIGQTVRLAAAKFAHDNNISSDPMSYAAFNEAAFGVVSRAEADILAKREENFKNEIDRQDWSIEQSQFSGLISAYKIPDKTASASAVDQSTRELQAHYNELYAKDPNTATKKFTSGIVSGLRAEIASDSVSPRSAIGVLRELAGKIQAGTGAWADTKEGMDAISNATAEFENSAATVENKAVQYRNQQDKLITETALSVVQTEGDLMTSPLLSDTRALELAYKIDEKVKDPTFLADPARAMRIVREAAITINKQRETENNFGADLNVYYEKRLKEDPAGAFEEVESGWEQGVVPTALRDAVKKRAIESLDTSAFLKEGGYTVKFTDLEKTSKTLYAKVDSPFPFEVIDAIDVEKSANLVLLGEDTFRTVSYELARKALAADPTLRSPQNKDKLVEKMSDVVNEAFQLATKTMTDKRKEEKDTAASPKGGAASPPAYGADTRVVELATHALDKVRELSPSGLTITETISYKKTLADLPEELGRLARKQALATNSAERTQITAAYNALIRIGGYGFNAVLTGKTDEGFSVPVEEIKQDPYNIPVFRNREELKAVLAEHEYAVQQYKTTRQRPAFPTTLTQLFDTLGITSTGDREKFINSQQQLVVERALEY